ncbi:methyltransferase [Mycolicibacterium confluentis]|uniref:methyltransferase n=1 Tax=Mycolicibacterium confluentis TaxID=28047 RepID=UPI0022A6B0E5|nr:methyltransferase [Mycolicibacterium confluentis]
MSCPTRRGCSPGRVAGPPIPPADLYVLKYVLHDWDEDTSIRIPEELPCVAAGRWTHHRR